MLKGFFRVGKDKVELRGYDRQSTFVFYLTAEKKTQELIDKGLSYESEYGETLNISSLNFWNKENPLFIQISEDNINVSKYSTLDNRKGVYNDLLKPYFQTLGGLIAGMKKCCTDANNIATDEVFGVNNEPNSTQIYEIKNITPPLKGKKVAYTGVVVRKHLKVHSMELGTNRTKYQLVLKDDGEEEERVKNNFSTTHKLRNNLAIFKDLEYKGIQEAGPELTDNLLTWKEIQERNPIRNYQWIEGRDYQVITTKEQFDAAIQDLMNCQSIIAFDTETTGLNFTFACKNGQGDRLVGLVFSTRPGQSYYFPIHHKAIPNICTEDTEYAVMQKYFKPILETKPILMHNGIFDMKVCFNYDIRPRLAEDTLILTRLTLQAEDEQFPYGLKKLTQKLLGRDSYELDDLVRSGNWGEAFDFSDLPLDYVRRYACADTDNTLELYYWFKRNNIYKKYDVDNVYYNIELPFSIVVAYSEYFGMHVDMDRAHELGEELDKDCNDLLQKIFEEAGHEFKVDSPQELGNVLYNELGCPILEKTATGNPSTSKNVLKDLAGYVNQDGSPKWPLINYLKEYKAKKKLITGFVNLLREDPSGKKKKKKNNISPDGIISSDVEPFLATGRVSVKNPNYQSFDDTVKKYITPREGHYMVDADYSSVEYRITASESGQENLIEAFFDPDTDYHKLKASIMFGIPYELVDAEQRHKAKTFNFGIPYGMSMPSLAKQMFGDSSPESMKKAYKLREQYFEGQEKVQAFFDNGRAEGWLLGRSRTKFGRYRYYNRAKLSKGAIERRSGNHKIQGTAADIYKMAMYRFYTKIVENGWWGKVLIAGFIHDECLLEVSCDINPAIILKTLRNAMMIEVEGWCPLYTGMGFGSCWEHAKHIEIPTQVQEKIEAEYGTTGFPWWNGNCEELYARIVDMIYDYKLSVVLDFLDNPENHHKTLGAVANDAAHDVVNAVMSGLYKKGVLRTDTLKKEKDTIKNLQILCETFGRMDLFEKADIQLNASPANTKPDVDFEFMNPEQFEEKDIDIQLQLVQEGVKAFGIYKANGLKRVFLNYDNKSFYTYAKEYCKTDGEYEVWLVTDQREEPLKTKTYIAPQDYSGLQETYMRVYG